MAPTAPRTRTATAPNTSAIPSQLRNPRNFWFMALALPPFRVHRPCGQEQAKGDEAEVVDQVLGVDDPLGEVVEVVGDGKVVEHLLRRRPRERSDPVDHPE